MKTVSATIRILTLAWNDVYAATAACAEQLHGVRGVIFLSRSQLERGAVRFVPQRFYTVRPLARLDR
eukprot:5463402-Lingulodinium_polyedra.AAC.1